MGTLKAEKKVFTAGQWLHGGTWPNHAALNLTTLAFVHRNHILVITLELARNRTAEVKKQG